MSERVYEISIIIATYNAEKTIQRCLDSIVNQDLSEVELVIIDGNSVDSTLKILESYSSVINILISERDNGIYDAWNKGVVRSHGNWIMFIGADDTLTSNSLKMYLDFIKSIVNKDCLDYISSKVEYVNQNGQQIKIIGTAYDWDKYIHVMNVAHVGSLHSRKLFESVGLYNCDYKICADYELLMRKGNKLNTLFMPQVTAQMSMGGVSCTKASLIEARNIKINIAQVNKFVAYLEYFIQLILLARMKYRFEN